LYRATPKELRELPGSAALKLQVEINNRYRKFPFKDPDLPRNLLPNRWPGARARVFFDEVHKALHDPAEKFVRALLSGATSEST
jgi:phenylacetic acid degradation operon negative regulatory protein